MADSLRNRSSGPKKHSFFGRSKRLALWAALVFFLFLVLWVFRSGWFAVKEVKVYFDGVVYEGDAISDFLRREFSGDNLWFVREENLRKKIQKVFFSVETVRLKRHLPDRLSVTVKSHAPLARFVTLPENVESSPSAILAHLSTDPLLIGQPGGVLITSDGLAFAESGPGGLTTIALPRISLSVGDRLSGGIGSFAIEVVKEMREKGVSAKFFSLFKEDVIVFPEGVSFILMTSAKKASDQVETAKMIIEKYKIEGKKLSKIDLRFKNPVVEFR